MLVARGLDAVDRSGHSLDVPRQPSHLISGHLQRFTFIRPAETTQPIFFYPLGQREWTTCVLLPAPSWILSESTLGEFGCFRTIARPLDKHDLPCTHMPMSAVRLSTPLEFAVAALRTSISIVKLLSLA